MGKQYDLFKTENEILQEALKDLKNNSYKDHPLQQKYQVLAQNYGKLLRQTIKMLKISDSQQRHLQRVQKDMRNLLDNAGQGFLTFGEELTVHKEYSSECLRIFGQKIENRNIIELLFSGCNADAKNEIIQALHSLWNSEFIQKEILQQLPALIDLNGRTYQLEYRPVTIINDSRGTNFIMLVITDVTESQKAFAQIDYLSSHDKLTGLYNRAHIDNAIVKLNNKDNLPMAMIMADVNGLKLTNDVFGHLEGDRLLQGIANVLRKSLRENDLIARWGGDEFLVVLTQADEEVVKRICERIKDTCAQTASDPVKLSIALGTSIRTNLNQTYYEIFSRAEDQMYTNKLQERPRFQQDFLYSIQRKLNDGTAEKDQHIERMRQLALAMSNKMGLDSAQTRDLETLAAIHDIGKVAIPFEILNKPGRLNENEWEFVQKHTEVGYRMSLALAEYQLAVCILSHHEHWDGSGYPNGLKGESIPLPARIISILDAYDIMTHDTSYKPALTPDQALAELDRCSGSQFDGELVEVFKGILT